MQFVVSFKMVALLVSNIHNIESMKLPSSVIRPRRSIGRFLSWIRIDKITVIGPSAGANKNAAREVEELLASEVLNALLTMILAAESGRRIIHLLPTRC